MRGQQPDTWIRDHFLKAAALLEQRTQFFTFPNKSHRCAPQLHAPEEKTSSMKSCESLMEQHLKLLPATTEWKLDLWVKMWDTVHCGNRRLFIGWMVC